MYVCSGPKDAYSEDADVPAANPFSPLHTLHAELKMVFRLTDKNGDGSITSTELKDMLHAKLSIDVDDTLLTDLMNSAGEQGVYNEYKKFTNITLGCPPSQRKHI